MSLRLARNLQKYFERFYYIIFTVLNCKTQQLTDYFFLTLQFQKKDIETGKRPLIAYGLCNGANVMRNLHYSALYRTWSMALLGHNNPTQ